jgi:sodium pump decarboxylase gamma subunit
VLTATIVNGILNKSRYVFFESIKIMFLGMGTVFLFLAIMVYMTKLMSKLILHYFPEAPKASASEVTTVNQKTIKLNNFSLQNILYFAIIY